MLKQIQVETFEGYKTLKELKHDINNFCKHKNVISVQYSNEYGLYNAMVVYKILII